MKPIILSFPLALIFATSCADPDAAYLADAEAIGADKVEVCHFNNGNHAYTLIDVSENALDTHLDHGDTLYADDQDCDGEADEGPAPFTIDELGDAVAEFEADHSTGPLSITITVNDYDYDVGGPNCRGDLSGYTFRQSVVVQEVLSSPFHYFDIQSDVTVGTQTNASDFTQIVAYSNGTYQNTDATRGDVLSLVDDLVAWAEAHGDTSVLVWQSDCDGYTSTTY